MTGNIEWRVERDGDYVASFISHPAINEHQCTNLSDGENSFFIRGAGEAFAYKCKPYFEAEIAIFLSGEPSIFTPAGGQKGYAEKSYDILAKRRIGNVSEEKHEADHKAFVDKWAKHRQKAA